MPGKKGGPSVFAQEHPASAGTARQFDFEVADEEQSVDPQVEATNILFMIGSARNGLQFSVELFEVLCSM